MGFAEGPVLPLAQSVMAMHPPKNDAALTWVLCKVLAATYWVLCWHPLVLVALATNFGWRKAFFIAGIPGLILALLCFFIIKESPAKITTQQKSKASIADLLKYHNVWMALLLSCCMMTWMFAQITFLPKYLVAEKHFSEADMGKTMAVFGLASLIWGAVVPGLSDKLGRKPVVIFFFLLSMLMPLGVVYGGMDFGSLAPLLLFGAITMGCYPIVLAIIPTETVPRQYLAQTMGFVMGIGELVGGFAAPAIAGWSADVFGLRAPFFIAAGAACIAGLLALLLIETAPIKKKQRDQKEAFEPAIVS